MNQALPAFENLRDALSEHLIGRGFARSRSADLWGMAEACSGIRTGILLRRQRYPSDKRIVCSPVLLVATAVAVPERGGKKFALSLKTAQIQKALLDGNMQKWYSIFPSTDPLESARDMIAKIDAQWVPRLSAIGTYHGLVHAIEDHWLSAGSPGADQAMIIALQKMQPQGFEQAEQAELPAQ
jgi:hypothetical protein